MELTLSSGETIKIDDDDFDKISHLTWFKSNKGYAIASTHVDGAIKNFYMHRLILNSKDGEQTDHINGDRLDNRRSNLRACTYTQNNMNLAKKKNCTSVQKGVYWCKQKNKWHARIKLHGIAKHLGFFTDEKEAGIAYNNAAKQLFGEFCRLNPV